MPKIIVKCLSADLQRISVKTDFSDVSAVICPDRNIDQSLFFPDFWRLAAKKAAASSRNSFILLRRLFSFSNAFIRFLSCWFSSAIFRDSSGLRSPQPISRLLLFAFLIQPYSVFTGIWSSFAAFTAPIFLQALLPALCTQFHIVYFLTSFFPPFFFFYSIPLRLGCQVLLYYII